MSKLHKGWTRARQTGAKAVCRADRPPPPASSTARRSARCCLLFLIAAIVALVDGLPTPTPFLRRRAPLRHDPVRPARRAPPRAQLPARARALAQPARAVCFQPLAADRYPQASRTPAPLAARARAAHRARIHTPRAASARAACRACGAVRSCARAQLLGTCSAQGGPSRRRGGRAALPGGRVAGRRRAAPAWAPGRAPLLAGRTSVAWWTQLCGAAFVWRARVRTATRVIGVFDGIHKCT
jgi:hypothetical protein